MLGKTSPAKTFTIWNRGTKTLAGLAIARSGADAGDFIVADPAASSLAPGQSTTFKVRFQPAAPGTRNAAIHLKSNDLNKKSFGIKLTGMGVE